MILEEQIKVIDRKLGKAYKIIGFVVDCTNKNEDEIMVLYKHYSTNEKADFVRTWAEFVEKFYIDVNEFYPIFEELSEIYTHSKVTANRPQMPKFETFEEIRQYIISSNK